jgi:uncharacterized damage-inducible protein DinB
MRRCSPGPAKVSVPSRAMRKGLDLMRASPPSGDVSLIHAHPTACESGGDRIRAVDSLWLETFRYHKWANLHLLGVCSDFTTDQLELTAPGTYGTIAATFLHLVGAEQGYLQRLGGERRRLTRDTQFPGIASLTDHAVRSGDELIAMAAKVEADDVIRAQFEEGPVQVRSGIVLIQALHHGNDHRTHICSILGHHGLQYGEMDVWAYGTAVGAIVPIGAG